MREAFSASFRRYLFFWPTQVNQSSPTFSLPFPIFYPVPNLLKRFKWFLRLLFVCSFRWYQDYRTNLRSHRYGFFQRAEHLSKICRISNKSASHFRVLCIYFLLSLIHFLMKCIDWLSGVWNRDVLKLISLFKCYIDVEKQLSPEPAQSSNVLRHWSWKYIYYV